MPPLDQFPLPLPLAAPPDGYFREVDQHVPSFRSDTVAFVTGIDQRDVLRGKRRCVICGESSQRVLQHCHIVPIAEPNVVS
jgi:hypothetical protein